MTDYTFAHKGYNYKIPKINWRIEDQFLIHAKAAGLDSIGEGDDVSSVLISEQGGKLRDFVLPLVYVEDGVNWKRLDTQYQDYHFKSAMDVYAVTGLAIEGLANFLEQSAGDAEKSAPKQNESQTKTNTQPRRKRTLT